MIVLCTDEREITGIFGPQDRWQITIESQGITKIEAYLEYGDTPWFAIHKGNVVSSRINAAFVEAVSYREDSLEQVDHDHGAGNHRV